MTCRRSSDDIIPLGMIRAGMHRRVAPPRRDRRESSGWFAAESRSRRNARGGGLDDGFVHVDRGRQPGLAHDPHPVVLDHLEQGATANTPRQAIRRSLGDEKTAGRSRRPAVLDSVRTSVRPMGLFSGTRRPASGRDPHRRRCCLHSGRLGRAVPSPRAGVRGRRRSRRCRR